MPIRATKKSIKVHDCEGDIFSERAGMMRKIIITELAKAQRIKPDAIDAIFGELQTALPVENLSIAIYESTRTCNESTFAYDKNYIALNGHGLWFIVWTTK